MRRLVAAISSALLAGCASYAPGGATGNPQETITVPAAFSSIATGLKNFGDTLNAEHLTLGLITCKVTVRFNISAEAARGGTIGGEIGAPTNVVDAKLSAKQTNSSNGSRENTIEVVLGSIYPGTCSSVDGGPAKAGAGQQKSNNASGNAGGALKEARAGGSASGAPGPMAPVPPGGIRVFSEALELRNLSQADIKVLNRKLAGSGLRVVQAGVTRHPRPSR